eukprot:CAMPEP_0197578914 /NCGR_PEP_ID=MMETSP1326-20131121/3016_1 /TAXON_ID=1155430 /ORGANISM="Genus nov. species nov., Strain RCC2288" /LENGTH=200 /DNA_ID=CAMNT_0043142213 /DNA_START=155 /DNA_END=754 /DNA_ORIENTATION=-
MASKGLPPPRAKYHEERIREIFTQIDATGDGVLSFLEIKRGLDENDIDWTVCGLDPEKIKRSIFKAADANGDKMLSFDEFWRFALAHGKGHGVDPVMDAHAYLTENKIIAILEAMTAALMVAKPEDPKAFLAEKLKELKASGAPVLAFSDEELVTMFSMFDPTGVGRISSKQCNKALEVLTGHSGTVGVGGAMADTAAPV